MSLSLFSNYRLRQLEALLEISRALTARLDLPSLLRTILQYTVEMVQAEVGYIALTTPAGNLRLATGYGLPSQLFHALAPYLAQKNPEQDFWNETELRRQLSIVREASDTALEQVVALPLVLEGEATVGGIFLFRSGSVAFSAGDRTMLRDFADQAAIAVRNARQVELLRAEKARVEAVIENSPNGVMILDTQLRVAAINRVLSELVGMSPAEARGKTCAEVLQLENATGEHVCQLEQTPPPTGILYGEGDIVRPRPQTHHRGRHLFASVRSQRQPDQYHRHPHRHHPVSRGRRTEIDLHFGDLARTEDSGQPDQGLRQHPGPRGRRAIARNRAREAAV